MTKTLKDLFEVYRPKAKGEQDFVDKHVTIKHKDRNGNKDDVFKATNIKPIDRETEHGYNPGSDEKVYEDYGHPPGNPGKGTEVTELPKGQLDELSKDTLVDYVKKANKDIDSNIESGSKLDKKLIKSKATKAAADYHWNKAEKRRTGVLKASDKVVNEDLEAAIKLGIKEYFAELEEDISDEDLGILTANVLEEFSEETPKANIFEHNFKEQRKSKADIVSSIVDKYAIVESTDEEISEENELINKLIPYLSETAILKVTALYDELDEENKAELLNLVETKEGINELLNFMIESSYSEKTEEVEEEE